MNHQSIHNRHRLCEILLWAVTSKIPLSGCQVWRFSSHREQVFGSPPMAAVRSDPHVIVATAVHISIFGCHGEYPGFRQNAPFFQISRFISSGFWGRLETIP